MAKDKKEYRVVQNEGKITWRIEEMWEGGVVRSPYGTREAAIAQEENIARENEFIDELTLKEVGGFITEPTREFEKDAEGNWQCVEACSINIDNKEVAFTKGMKFTEGEPHMGIDVAKWLDEHYKK